MNKGFEDTVEDKCVKSIANFLFVPSPLPSLIFPTIFPVNTAGSRSTEHKLCLILQRKERKKEVWQNKGMEYTHTISWHPFKWHRVSVTDREGCFIKKKRKKIRERERTRLQMSGLKNPIDRSVTRYVVVVGFRIDLSLMNMMLKNILVKNWVVRNVTLFYHIKKIFFLNQIGGETRFC